MFDIYPGFLHTQERVSGKEETAIPQQVLIAKELAELLGAIAHPHRLMILVDLQKGEMDVNSLQRLLGISHSSVSQHLAILRTHHLVRERRQGRHVYYALSNPAFARWLLQGLDFLEGSLALQVDLREAVQIARREWQRAGQTD